MLTKSSRFALIASLCAAHSAAVIPPDVELMPLPARATGSRFSRDTNGETSRAILAARIQSDLSRPRNMFALALV